MPQDRSAPLQLSFAQQRLWFLSQLEGVSEAYHIPLALRLRGELDERALRSALDRLVARHEALRTSFVSIDGEAFQRVEPAEVGFHLAAHDIGVAEDAAAALGELIAAEAAAPFDLERGPLVRGRLVKVGVDEHVLLLTMHHIVSDGWSMGVFTRELNALYDAYSRGEPDLLAPLPVQYADYSAWQRRVLSGSHLADQSAYWLEQLSGSPVVLDLPTDHKRPLQQDFAGDFVEFGLDRTLTRQLKALSQRCGATLFMTVLAGWATVLSRLANQTELVIGAPSANRTRVEVEGLIGFFVNTLALRVDLSGAPSAEELIGRIRTLTVGAQKNQDLPFEQVVELLRPTRSLAHSPIFQVMFAWENNEQADLDLRGLTAEAISVPGQTSKFDLTLFLSEHDGQIVGGLEFATALFRRETVERFAGYLRTVLSEMASDGSRQVAKLPILSTEERHQQLVSWNATEAEFPRELCVHQLFEAQVRRDPEAVALVHEERSLSYGELNRRANRLAHHLRERGVRPDSRVAICVERSLDMVVGLLGIMKAGGAYVPLDPAYPSDRLAFMLADSAPVLALTHGAAQAALQRAMAGLEVAVVDLDRDQALWAYGPEHDLEPAELGLTSSNLAYVIYTSGSTGTPKGVMVEHGNLNRLIAAVGVEVDFGPGDIWSLAHSISFDFSVWEIWGALTTGGGVVILGYSTTRSPEQFWECLANARVSVLNQTPSSFASLTSANLTAEPLSDLRCVIFGGEALEASALNAWRLRNDMRARLVNMYGITEATVHATFASVTEDGRDHKGSVIGRPLADVRIYLLDGLLEPVPVGVAGEIYIGGAGVARGYLNRPELTAERFIASPFVEGDRLYKTGDLGRYLADGNIEFLGRNDFQVKIRGFRIELGEIETQLAQHAGVREAVVLAREREDEPGDKRLAAYYTAADPADAPDAEALRRHLSARLPEHMVPAAYVLIEALPLTPNGKLDRKALPAPDAQALVSRAYEAPRGEVETALAGIWAEVLRLERVGRNDNFFELGGHSLLAVKMLERMRRAGFEADVRALFASPTIVALATTVDRSGRQIVAPPNRITVDCEEITPDLVPLVKLSQAEIDTIVASVEGGVGNVQDIYPLAPLQEGILFHHLMAKDGDPYLLWSLLSFADKARLEAYVAALNAVIGRHDVLRTAVLWEGLPEPVQVVWRTARLQVEEVVLGAGAGDVAERLKAFCDPRQRRIRLDTAPLMRLFVARDEVNDRWVGVMLSHHLSSDHTTLELMFEEVQAHLSGDVAHLSTPQPFRNFVAQARLGISKEEHETFFRDMLGEVDEPTAPFGLMDVQGDGSNVAEASLELDAALCARLRERARQLGVSVASLFHVAWGQVLAKTSAREDAVFGTVLFGRMQGGEAADEVLGLFINTLPIRIELKDVGVEQCVRRTHALLAGLLRHEHASLALAQRCSGVPAPAPLFTSLLNYRHSSAAAMAKEAAPAWEGIEYLTGEERTNYPFAISVDDLGSGFQLTAQTQEPVGPARVCAMMERVLVQLAELLDHSPLSRVGRIDVLSTEERHQQLVSWNATEAEFPRELCVHQLFEAQVRRDPEAVALVHEERSLSYGELNRRANRLAHHLRERGVRPDSRVAICVERSLDMVVGLLGIMKAGGAYVPLDPAYPSDRLAFMLADSAPVLALTHGAAQAALQRAMAGLEVAVVDLDRDQALWAYGPEHDLEPAELGLTSSNLAYVIYTSGSTGTPKGVMVEHRNLVNLVLWHGISFVVTAADRVPLTASIGFDAAAWEIWGGLCSSATVLLPPSIDSYQVSALLDWWFRQDARMGFLATGLSEVARTSIRPSPRFELLLVGGEALRSLESSWPKQLVNNYGPTETTVVAASTSIDCDVLAQGIGRPISNTRIYLLDGLLEPVPVGVAGEIYIGGAGVARGYLNRPELTAERFIASPFVEGDRLYKTGDLGRYLADGNIEFLGRNDFQVKIRGFRIELGEIETQLAQHAGVREAVVLAREREDEPGDKRLAAYYTAADPADAPDAEALRRHLSARLPEHMVPAAYVLIEALPLTPNGKLDRKALPAPDAQALVSRAYEAPRGEVETALAGIWAEVLRLERVGRNDNFFELGGHSLLAVKMLERMRRAGFEADVRALFASPTIVALATTVDRSGRQIVAPPNRITVDCEEITPDLVPLVKLSQAEIDTIVASVEGGVGNVQDIYPLAPLQEGILFHHLMAKDGDPYLLWSLLSFADKARLEAYVAALNAVIGRHDVLRTAVLWEGLPEPVQVVWRTARLQVEEVVLGAGAGDVAERLKAFCDPRQRRIRLDTAPLMRLFVARDEVNDRWVGVMLSHHLSSDHTTLELMFEEVQAHLSGDVAHLSTPQPFRNFVAQARLGISKEEHETFFRDMLGEVDEPTAPFGLMDVQGDGSNVAEASLELDAALCARLRERARQLGVSVASLFHVAWGQVLAKTSAREDAVFGTVLFGRMQGGEAADEVLGLFINTLPIRIELKDVGVEQCVRRTHALLAGLLRHEHASLALAQRCSGVPAPAPLFTSLLNYRHSSAAAMAKEAAPAWEGIEYLTGEERTNYPFAISVDDLGSGFQLTAQTQEPVGPARVCAMMERVLVQLAELLDHSPLSRVGRIDVLSTEERHQQLVSWNATEAEFPRELCVHQLFEAQVRRDPEAVALVHEERSLSYGELNRRANRLAHHLRERGVRPDSRVAICVERSLDMVVGLLGIMKAGGAYVPLDPAYPSDRLAFMLADSAPVLALTHGAAQAALQRAMAGLEVAVVDLDRDQALWAYGPEHDLEPAELGLTSSNLAYVIYTSGSTGTPKGVMVEHRNLVNLVEGLGAVLSVKESARFLQSASISFDPSVSQIFMPLSRGGASCLDVSQRISMGPDLERVIQSQSISHLDVPVAVLGSLSNKKLESLRVITLGGVAPPVEIFDAWVDPIERVVFNAYGPTEASICVTVYSDDGTRKPGCQPPIGRPISNTRIYLLDGLLEPVPVGVAGEIYIGGAGVARGYLNRPELTAERFIASPFVEGDRLYKTGDLGRYLADGNIEFLGRNDFQVKIRGFRIELGEIETQLAQHAGVREAVVLAREREDEPGDKRLAAYYTAADPADAPDAEALRRHLSARLPEHMVPAAYVLIEALPLTPNGKLDRKALPAPDAQALVSRAYEAPRGEVETALAGIWAEVLRLERVGRNDNFFELGGHSLLAVKMLSKVRQLFDVDLALAALFAEPTLKGLTQRVADASRDTLPPISVADRSAPLQLSFAQQRLWFLSQLEGVSEAYHIPLALRLRGELDERALRSALDRLVARHEALRTSFVSIDGEAFQRVEPAEVGFHLAAHDIGVAEDAAAALGELIAAEAAALFDLERGPLVRGRLVKVGVDEHVLLLTMHHIVSDGWSMGVFTRELNALYDAYSRGEPDLLAPLPVQYADYSAWQRRVLSGSHLADQSAYWLEQLSGSPVVLDLPTDHKRPLQQDFAGDFVEFGLDRTLTRQLKALSQRCGATLFMTVLAGWATVLSRLANQTELVIGAPSANRTRVEVEGLIGFFVNTLALRVDLSGAPSAEELIGRIRTLTVGAQKNQDLPFEQVVELLRPTRSLAHSPIFQVMFAWENNEQADLDLRGLTAEAISVPGQTSKFDLTLFLSEHDGQIVGGLEFATALFRRETVERFAGYLRTVLSEMASDGSRQVAKLPILSTEERHQQLVSWNATEAEFPRELCVHQLFEAQVRRDPEAVALVHEERSLSYGELNRRANRLAHHLRERGVRPDSRVAICVERSLDMVVGLLGIMKAGGAYVPLDPAYPSDRLAFMLADSAPVLALTHGAAQAALQRAMAGLEVAVVDLDRDQALWAYGPEHDLEPAELGLTSSNLAYVIYTSGSTGTPKGVMVEHRNTTNLLCWSAAEFGTAIFDRVWFSTSVSFDLSIFEVFGPLSMGGCAHVHDAPPDASSNISSVTLFNLVPSAVSLLLNASASVRTGATFCFAGEPLARELVQLIMTCTAADSVYNLYAPTETTTYSTVAHCGGNEVISIGRPISNTRIYLLDGLLEPVPVGVAGEIYIGGAGVARGYLNRPELTAERFIASPFVEGDRLYKTGDLGRYLADGNIEFLGRNDFQVKIRGFRIELGEIETQLAQHAGVREAVVLAREDEPGDKRLAAYYTAADPADAPDAEALRRHLSARLPEHMVPAAYVLIEALPLTPNGKLDRKALPAPDAQALVSRAYEAPRGEVETALAGIWAEVLRLERVGRNDNFFELGGHSLLAVKMLSKVRQLFDVDLALAALFAEPTLKGLTQRVADASRDTLPPISVADRSAPLQLSFAQQRLWFLSQLEGVSEAYHIPLALRLRGELDERALRSALDRLVARHEALRTSFVSIDGEAFQRVEPAEVGFHLAAHDIGVAEDAAAALGELIAAEAAALFDLERGPLVRGRLVKVGVDEHVLLLTMHHIVSDGWSMGVFTRELNALYDAYSRGEPDLLAPLPVQYADYSAWQRRVLSGSHLADQSAYWLEQLSGSPVVLDLPTDHKRPLQQDFAGDFVEFGLDRTLTRQLKALSQRCGATLFMTVLAGWATVLSRLANQTELVIGAPSANRTRVEVEGLIGFFVNTLALRVDLSGAPSAEELIGRIRTLTVGAQKNQDLPFEQVVELLRPTRSLAHSPIFQVMFAWENNEQADLDLRGLTAEAISVPGQTSKFDLTLFLSEHDGQIVGGLEFATALFRRETVERFAGYLRTVLSEMASDGSRQVAKLPILSTEERHQQLVSWNATEAEFPRELCVHQLFEAQVRRDPEAVALVHEERSLSYGELNRRANRLAHHLRERGVRPDSRVAICVERSLDMVVGLLGIMKAGGAYVPLDPAYPSDRLAFMLADSAPVLALTHGAAQAALQRAMAGLEVAVVDLDRDQALWAYGPEHDLEPAELGLTSSNLAYVIYTSGSTGTPKGVMVEHGSVVNYLYWAILRYVGRLMSYTYLSSSLSFDATVTSLYIPLLCGWWLFISAASWPLEVASDCVPALLKLTPGQADEVLHQLAPWNETPDEAPSTLVLGGEALTAAHLGQIARVQKRIRVFNEYGPTEATVGATTFEVSMAAARIADVPIGRPISNTRIYLLDGLLEPVPVGVAGEIYIGGAGVARGYLNRPELTAERFIASPFVEGDRLYKTGDLGRYLADGNIEFLGRNDFQVKIRGFRIELGEIETQLAQHAGVREAVVLAREREDEPGDKRLAAYYTAADPADAPDAEALRRHLSARLPEHMVPAAYVLIEALPLTPNGKLDRKALPAPDAQALVSRAYEAPRGEVETALAGIWAEVLRLERVGRNDNFFELGGHSLLAVKVLERMRRAGFEADVRALFQAKSLADFAALVNETWVLTL